MRNTVLLGLLLSIPPAWSADDPVAVKAWFTEAQMTPGYGTAPCAL